jgi:6-phosphogluconolactonase (cycloisomerase 2 family)
VLSNSTAQVVTSYPQVSMDVSPDGKWLAALDSSSLAPTVKVYQISSGSLTLESQVALVSVSSRTLAPAMVRFSPDNNYIAVAMGGNGVLVIPFTDSTGAQSTTTSFYIAPNSAATGDNAIAWDGNDNLYIGRSTANTGSSGDTGVWIAPASDFSGSGSYLSVGASLLATTDSAPRALAFADSYGLLYTANAAASTINGFSVSTSSGSVKLTSLGATAAPSTVEALAVDNSGNYLIAAGTTAGSGLQLYSIGSSGALTAQNTEPTGTANGYPVLAVTH